MVGQLPDKPAKEMLVSELMLMSQNTGNMQAAYTLTQLIACFCSLVRHLFFDVIKSMC